VRHALGEAGRLIETVHGYGYKLAWPVASQRKG
jgi:DNA-binding winged helix-turn-helix (wHTH) protein